LAADSSTVVQWDFGTEETTQIMAHGDVQRDIVGPVSPEFPDFSTTNTAVRLDGQGARFTLEDTGANSPYDFTNGDSITLEAWVKIEDLRDGQNMYIIGKGRTGSPHFPKDNQNWALRVVGQKGTARLSFLFATPEGGADHWHRWTSNKGFDLITGWHHIAVQYTFGDPTTVKGWIDGQSSDGVWDMGGATTKAPIVDDDAIWIRSTSGGNPSNSFYGSMDAVAVHRAYLSKEVMVKRFNRVGGPRVVGPVPEVMPEINDIPEGQVLVTFHERFSSYERWLYEGENWPEEQSCLLSPRLIQQGVRFIEVSHNLNFLNGAGWDMHNEGILNQHDLIKEMDTAISALIMDLEEQKLLDKTLIMISSEFGRPPTFDARGGRGHQGSAFSCVLAGGGLAHKGAWGETDELSKKIVSNPVGVPDLFATVLAALGVDYTKNLYAGDRPIPMTDGGQPIAGLFS
jgi:hypothetical protein